MKKKVLFGLGAIAVMAILSLNINVAVKNQKGDVSLIGIETVANADAESLGYYYNAIWCPSEGRPCLMANYGNNYMR